MPCRSKNVSGAADTFWVRLIFVKFGDGIYYIIGGANHIYFICQFLAAIPLSTAFYIELLLAP
jgi:hypothetical protein